MMDKMYYRKAFRGINFLWWDFGLPQQIKVGKLSVKSHQKLSRDIFTNPLPHVIFDDPLSPPAPPPPPPRASQIIWMTPIYHIKKSASVIIVHTSI